MTYQEAVAGRVRRVLAGRRDVTERRMFGGLAFLLRGHMICGLAGEDLMVRVGPLAHEESLALPHARPMDFTGRPLHGYVYVAPEGYASDRDLRAWVWRAIAHALTLPLKSAKARKK